MVTIETNLKNYLLSKKQEESTYVIGKERHEDGGIHYHLYIQFQKKITVTKQDEFDIIAGKHGNYKTIGKTIEDEIRVLRYVIKEDDYIEYNIKAKDYIKFKTCNSNNTKRQSVAKGESVMIMQRLKEGASYPELIKEFPTYCLNNGRKLKEFIRDLQNVPEYDEDDIPQDLYTWQQDLIDTVRDKPHSRKVIWYYDKNGNTGKSTMKKLLCKDYNAFYATGKCQDMYYSYAKQPIVIFDIPRTQEDHVNYTAIEDFKNGMVYSTKYESMAKVFKKPHVIVFANFKPNMKALSHDRWDIRDITVNEQFTEEVIDTQQVEVIQEIIDTEGDIDVKPIFEPYHDSDTDSEFDYTDMHQDDDILDAMCKMYNIQVDSNTIIPIEEDDTVDENYTSVKHDSPQIISDYDKIQPDNETDVIDTRIGMFDDTYDKVIVNAQGDKVVQIDITSYRDTGKRYKYVKLQDYKPISQIHWDNEKQKWITDTYEIFDNIFSIPKRYVRKDNNNYTILPIYRRFYKPYGHNRSGFRH